jgi:hypothetical protein
MAQCREMLRGNAGVSPGFAIAHARLLGRARLTGGQAVI